MLVLLLVKCKHGMRWAKCSLFIARKFVRTVYLRGWLRCPINLPVNIWKVRWNVNTLLGSTVHNKNKTVMDAGSWGLVVSIRWFQPMRVRTRFLFLVASHLKSRRHDMNRISQRGIRCLVGMNERWKHTPGQQAPSTSHTLLTKTY